MEVPYLVTWRCLTHQGGPDRGSRNPADVRTSRAPRRC